MTNRKLNYEAKLTYSSEEAKKLFSAKFEFGPSSNWNSTWAIAGSDEDSHAALKARDLIGTISLWYLVCWDRVGYEKNIKSQCCPEKIIPYYCKMDTFPIWYGYKNILEIFLLYSPDNGPIYDKFKYFIVIQSQYICDISFFYIF